MKTNGLKTLALGALVSAISAFIIFYALVGFICLHMTKPMHVNTCETTMREGSMVWCGNHDE